MPVKFDLSKVTYSGLLEVLAPVVPGGVLAIGTILLRPALANALLDYGGLGYRTKVFLAGCAAYIAGLLLQLLVNYTSYAVGYCMAALFADQLPKGPEPWKNSYWRKVARKFIGDLGPSTDELYFKETHEAAWKAALAVQDENERLQQQHRVTDQFLRLSLADSEWYWWYQILNSYFTKTAWHAPPAGYFLGMVHSSAWAVIFLMFSSHNHHWLAWLLCLLGLFFGNVGQWFAGGLHGPDPYGVELTARILKALKVQPENAKPEESELKVE